MSEDYGNALPPGSKIGKYRIERVLGSGGFGITYLATDSTLGRSVALKECLPIDFAHRKTDLTIGPISKTASPDFFWAIDRFKSEAITLAKVDHPNVVSVFEIIETNGTAYMATGYEEGKDFENWLVELERAPNADEVMNILSPLLSGLEAVHKLSILHRDISPDNIYITKSGKPVLLDFGSARQIVSNRSRALTAVLKPGYAPFEQYHEKGNQGPWTDIYAVCATLHRAVIGSPPPDAALRERDDPYAPLAAELKSQYPNELLSSIDHGLKIDETERIQSVSELKNALKPLTTIVDPTGPVVSPNRAKWTRYLAYAGFAAVSLMVAVLYYLHSVNDSLINNEPEAPRSDSGSGPESLIRPVGYEKLDIEQVHRDSFQDIELNRKAAESGDARAQFVLALQYADGRNVEKDAGRASYWFRKAAEQGLVEAQVSYGLLFVTGEGGEIDYAEAVKWFQKAAEQGYGEAQYQLGNLYLQEKLGERDDGMAIGVNWYKKAAENGNKLAQNALGYCYFYGYGVDESREESVMWYRKAAEQGLASAQNSLGIHYSTGEGVEKDHQKAHKWYLSAANQGHEEAQLRLARQYLEGTGTDKDTKEAVVWLRELVSNGNAKGQLLLGMCYMSGTGVAQSMQEALRLYRLAADQGDIDAERLVESIESSDLVN